MSRIQKVLKLILTGILIILCTEALLSASDTFEENRPEELLEELSQDKPENLEDNSYYWSRVNPKRPQEQQIQSLILNISYGMLAYSPAVLSYGKEIFKLPWRFGAQAGPKLIMGGKGFNFELQLRFVYQNFTEKWQDVFGPGIVAGINYSFVHRWMIISTGFGISASVLWGSEVTRVLESVGRVPVKLAWYPKEWFGLTVELAFLFGITIVEAEKLNYLASSEKNGSKGLMPGLECNLGFQFP